MSEKDYLKFLVGILDKGEYLSEEEMIDLFKISQNINVKKLGKEKKRFSLALKKLKKEVITNIITRKESVKKLSESINYAASLKETSFENYETLNAVAGTAMLNPNQTLVRGFLFLGDYCKDFNDISNRFIFRILNRPNNRSLVLTLDDAKNHIDKLYSSNSSLIDYFKKYTKEEKTYRKKR